MERKTGENFDDKTAEDIFDKLKNVEGKIKPKLKGKFDNITNLMQEAESLVKDNNYDEADNCPSPSYQAYISSYINDYKVFMQRYERNPYNYRIHLCEE